MNRNRFLILAVLGISFVLVALGLAVFLISDDVPSSAVLRVRLGEDLPEEPSHDVVSRVLGWKELTLYDVVRGLDAAAADERVGSVLISVSDLHCGLGRAQDLRQAIGRYRASGGRVEVMMPRGGLVDYYIASAADRVFIAPAGSLTFAGVAFQVPFVRGTLDTLGIVADFERSGEDKDSPEVYTRSQMSDTMRANLERVAGTVIETLVTDVAASRGLEPSAVRALLDVGFFSPAAAVSAGLVDGLSHIDEVRATITGASGDDPKDLELSDYLKTLGAGWLARPPRIALVYATGLLVSGESVDNQWAGRMTGSNTLTDVLKDVREDDGIVAVVLRIDSPGGSSVASDVIWREVKRTSEAKPVIVSMGDYAASGGYYIAAGADRVLAQPMTFTGSIGVYSGKFAMRGLWEWMGMNFGTVKGGENADIFSELDPWTDQQRDLVRRQIAAVHARFVEVVARGRSIQIAELESLATGRVFTGREALAHGLVDAIGGLGDAVDAARRQAGIESGDAVRVEVWPRSGGWISGLFSAQAGRLPASGPRRVLAEMAVLDRLAEERVSLYSPVRMATP